FACSDVANLHAWREQVWIEHDRPCECLCFCQACSNMDASKRFQRDFTVVRADHARPGRAGNCVIRVGIDLTAEKPRRMILNQITQGSLFRSALNEDLI